jgi:hypothetical protein
MRITSYTDGIDLRTVVSKSTYLKRMAGRFNLKNGEAACFTNKAQTRFRLIFKLNSTVLLCLPEIDEKNQYSIYLRISDELAKLAGLRSPKVKLQLLNKKTKERIEKQQKRLRKKHERKTILRKANKNKKKKR